MQHCRYIEHSINRMSVALLDLDELRHDLSGYFLNTRSIAPWAILSISDNDDTNSSHQTLQSIPDSKVHGANMGPAWGRQDPGGPMLA